MALSGRRPAAVRPCHLLRSPAPSPLLSASQGQQSAQSPDQTSEPSAPLAACVAELDAAYERAIPHGSSRHQATGSAGGGTEGESPVRSASPTRPQPPSVGSPRWGARHDDRRRSTHPRRSPVAVGVAVTGARTLPLRARGGHSGAPSGRIRGSARRPRPQTRYARLGTPERGRTPLLGLHPLAPLASLASTWASPRGEAPRCSGLRLSEVTRIRDQTQSRSEAGR